MAKYHFRGFNELEWTIEHLDALREWIESHIKYDAIRRKAQSRKSGPHGDDIFVGVFKGKFEVSAVEDDIGTWIFVENSESLVPAAIQFTWKELIGKHREGYTCLNWRTQ